MNASPDKTQTNKYWTSYSQFMIIYTTYVSISHNNPMQTYQSLSHMQV